MTRRSCIYININVILFFLISLTTYKVSSRQLINVNVLLGRKFCPKFPIHDERTVDSEIDKNIHFTCDSLFYEKYHNLGVFLGSRYNNFLNSLQKSGERVLLFTPTTSEYFSDVMDGICASSEINDYDHNTGLGDFFNCSNIFAEEERVLKDASIKAKIAKHEPFFSYVRNKTGMQINTPYEMAKLYSYYELIAESEEASLPDWIKGFFPDGQMLEVTLLSNYIRSKSTILKHMAAGTIIDYIVWMSTPNRPLFYVYEVQNNDIAVVLQSLNLVPFNFLLDLGATIIFEEYIVNNVLGYEIRYYTGFNTNKMIQLTLPGCDVFCPVETFIHIFREFILDEEYSGLSCFNKAKLQDEQTHVALLDTSDMPNFSRRGMSNDPAPLILKQVHVIFSHKLNGPLESDIAHGFPAKLDYQYFLENTLEMTKESERDMFEVGLMLRERYDGFLGDEYYYEVMKMRTSEYFLSRISGHLVSKGLWPAKKAQIWEDNIHFQPIPIEYNKRADDTLFLGTLCPKFDAEMKLIFEKESSKDEILEHQVLFSYITKNSGINIDSPSKLAMLYSYFETIAKEPNATLPEWTKSIYPHLEMEYVRSLSYEMLSKSNIQKQLNGGTFIKNIIKDSESIINPKNKLPVGNKKKRDLKISLYSGDERNLAGVFHAMNVWPKSRVPENGAAVIFELRHDETNNIYGYKMFYYTGYKDSQILPLILKGCKVPFCPFNKFTKILKDSGILSDEDEKLLCNTIPPA